MAYDDIVITTDQRLAGQKAESDVITPAVELAARLLADRDIIAAGEIIVERPVTYAQVETAGFVQEKRRARDSDIRRAALQPR